MATQLNRLATRLGNLGKPAVFTMFGLGANALVGVDVTQRRTDYNNHQNTIESESAAAVGYEANKVSKIISKI